MKVLLLVGITKMCDIEVSDIKKKVIANFITQDNPVKISS
jgi:hypothetical protein